MSEDDNIIQFPGASDAGEPAAESGEAKSNGGISFNPQGMPNLSPDQEKALHVILSGMSFVCIGVKPSDGGADFFTAVEGDEDDLRNAQPHLEGVIERAFDRKGI